MAKQPTTGPKVNDLSGGIDLAPLKTPQANPPGTYSCAVPGGCGLLLRITDARRHQTIGDCLDTCQPYVEIALKADAIVKQLDADLTRVEKANKDLLTANQRLIEERDEARRKINN